MPSIIKNNFKSAVSLFNKAGSKSLSPKDNLTKYIAAPKGKIASAASSGDKKIILSEIIQLNLTSDEAVTILHGLNEALPDGITQACAGTGNTELVRAVLAKLRDDHRSVSFFHCGATESYKVAIQYLQKIAMVESVVSDTEGTGRGAFGLFAKTRYKMAYLPEQQDSSVEQTITEEVKNSSFQKLANQQKSVSNNNGIISFKKKIILDKIRVFKENNHNYTFQKAVDFIHTDLDKIVNNEFMTVFKNFHVHSEDEKASHTDKNWFEFDSRSQLTNCLNTSELTGVEIEIGNAIIALLNKSQYDLKTHDKM